jgi:peroxiredoxin family protein
MAIIATKGHARLGLSALHPGLHGAALGWDVSIFFTFYGLNLLKKDVSDLKVSPLGNPGMPMKMPFGPEWFKGINWNIPNIVQAGVPGFENLATDADAADHQEQRRRHIEELRGLAQEADVKFIACQMTVDLFGFSHDDFIAWRRLRRCGDFPAGGAEGRRQPVHVTPQFQ